MDRRHGDPRDIAFMIVLAAGLGLFFVGFDPVSATAPNWGDHHRYACFAGLLKTAPP
jgi:Na+-transporting NADH:ubiquinone oxidoreductase subunit NqrB